MSHSVSSHLSLDIARYDVEIRRFVPHYEALLEEASGAVRSFAREGGAELAPVVLDLGAGTGALASAVLGAVPSARLVLLDADAAMLEVARTRLGGEAEIRHGSFTDPLPACDVAVASLSLHHVREPSAKRALYARIAGALRPGGLFVNADAMIGTAGATSRAVRDGWIEHLVRGGDTPASAAARLAEWALEDTYFPVTDELAWMGEAGFEDIDVRLRRGPMAVVTGRAPAR